MALAAASASASASGTGTNHTEGEVTIARLYVLRATYLLLIVGLGDIDRAFADQSCADGTRRDR